MLTFTLQNNVGSARYVVNHHDGTKTNRNGSPFFDLAIFKNKKKRDEFVRGLLAQGYRRA